MLGNITNQNNQTAEVQQSYSVKVTRVQAIKQDTYAFDADVNGVTIYSMIYREGVKNGKKWSLISFPARKGKDNKYYNNCFFPISNALKAEIINQMNSLLGGA